MGDKVSEGVGWWRVSAEVVSLVASLFSPGEQQKAIRAKARWEHFICFGVGVISYKTQGYSHTISIFDSLDSHTVQHYMKKLLALTVLVTLFLSSCSEKQVTRMPRYRHDGSLGYFNDKNFKPEAERKMIFNASLRLSVPDADTLNRELNRMTTSLSGYAVTLGYSKSTIRVPSEKLNEAISTISKMGKMSEKKITGTDVTDEYKDYTVRLDNANKARQRYLELLQKAENVEAALKVEKELERLNGEIELMKGKMERINHLESYSTIDIDIHQREKPGVLGYVALGAYKAVKWLFVRG
jgi:Domain of unknown function (DUF4349)